jgi:regulator of protease activity HflC (stomatin/prohibitin superfamily)
MNKKFIAEKDKEAATVTAEAVVIKAEGDAKAEERMAEARGKRVRETISALVLPGGSPDVATRGAADVLEMEAAAGESSKLTTLVKGGAPAVVPIGGEKEGKK